MTEVSGSHPDGKKIGTFASLRIPNFRLLLIGTLLSNAGNFMRNVVLNWLVYDLTGSGTILGTINLVTAIASLFIIPIAGLLIDRLRRRTLLMIENGWLFTITLSMGLIVIFGHYGIPLLFAFAFLGGMVRVVDFTLRQVLVFDLVPRSHTPNAMALIQTGWGLTRSLGPALGGFLISWFGPGSNFFTQSFAYFLVVITIVRINYPARKSEALLSSPLENVREGVLYVMKNRLTQIFMMMGFVLPIFIIPIFSVLPAVYAVDVFGDPSGQVLGFLMASVGAGSLFGGIFTASLGRMERRGLLQLVSLFLLSLSLVSFAFCTTLWVALLFLAMAGFFEVVFLVTNQTLLQLTIPDNIRGRVTSVVNLNMVLTPLGGLMAGIGSDMLGGPKMITIVMAGIAAAIAVIVLVFSPTVRSYRMSQAIVPDSGI